MKSLRVLALSSGPAILTAASVWDSSLGLPAIALSIIYVGIVLELRL